MNNINLADGMKRLHDEYGAYSTVKPLGPRSTPGEYAYIVIPSRKGRSRYVIGKGHHISHATAFPAAWNDAVHWANQCGWPDELPPK